MKYDELVEIDNKYEYEIKIEELSLENEQIKRAVWQYIIDHATPHRVGYLVRFAVKNEHTFWTKVKARQVGAYSRTNPADIEKMIYTSRRKEYIDGRIKQLKKDGPWHVRFIIGIKEKLDEYLLKYVKTHFSFTFKDFIEKE